jgi:hypothetical protein
MVNLEGEELRQNEEAFINICLKATKRIAFGREESPKFGLLTQGRESALWVRGYLGDGVTVEPIYKPDSKPEESPIIKMKDRLEGHKVRIEELYKEAKGASFVYRKSGSPKETGMVHDDERAANILKTSDSKDTLFIIDFEHSHWAYEDDPGIWRVKNVRNNRPFPHSVLEPGQEHFQFKHLRYRWDPEGLVPDVMRSHANALVNISMEVMHDAQVYPHEKCRSIMIEMVKKGMETPFEVGNFGGNMDVQLALYRLHLIDRAIHQYRYFNDIPAPREWNEYINDLFDVFLNGEVAETS